MTKEELRNNYIYIKAVEYDFDFSPLENIISKYTNILIYHAIGKEPVIHNFFFNLKDKNIFFPKVENNSLTFYKATNDSNFKLSSYKILEPLVGEILLDFSNLLIFIPGLFFTLAGKRLGHGMGYYDKFLSKVSNSTKIGVCYNNFILQDLETTSNDVGMDYVFNGKQLFSCN